MSLLLFFFFFFCFAADDEGNIWENTVVVLVFVVGREINPAGGVWKAKKKRKTTLRSAEEKEGDRIISIKAMAIHLLPFKINGRRACKQLIAYSQNWSGRVIVEPKNQKTDPQMGSHCPMGFPQQLPRNEKKAVERRDVTQSARDVTKKEEKAVKNRCSSARTIALCRSKTGSGRGGRCCVTVVRAPNQIKTHGERATSPSS